MKEEMICPKCGCKYFEIVVPALSSEDEVYQCPSCETIFDAVQILVEKKL